MSRNARSGSAADCLTIELAMDAVRVAEVQQRADARVARSAVESLPRDLWSSLVDRRSELAGAIKRAVVGSGTSRRRAVVSLPRQLVMVRLARLPRADAAQMRGLVAFEAQQHILFPIDDVVLDYAQVKETSITEANAHDDLQPVLLAAAQRRIINEVMAAVTAAGLSVDRLTVSTLALAEHARESTGTIAVVTAESGEAQVSVVADGAPLFSRAANLPQATDLNALETDLAGEIARSLAAFSTEFRQARIDAVWLGGAAAAAPGGTAMAQRLESVLELPVTLLESPLVRAGDHDGIRYAVSVGAAAQDSGAAIAGVNLMPQDELEHRRRRRQAFAGRLGVAGAAVALVLVVVIARAWLINSAAAHKADLAANNQLAQSQKAL
ncbi:MAG: pilus assembly protein PilM, partial [Armatimonadetes bacterium]|nr:pilus assembly protein PilM [Armatimonadota bacterium]